MKTIKGTVLSTAPVSLSKAASILSNFVSTDTGASHAVVAYLCRTSEALNELTQLHKVPKPDRKHKKKQKSVTAEDVSLQQLSQGSGELSEEKVSYEVKHKKKKTKDSGQAEIEEVKLSQENELGLEVSHGIKHDKRKKEKSEVDSLANDEVETGNFDSKVKEEAESERERHRKKKRDRDSFEENGGQIEIEKEEKKGKRKNQEAEDEGNLEEHQRKKKRRKSEGDSRI